MTKDTFFFLHKFLQTKQNYADRRLSPMKYFYQMLLGRKFLLMQFFVESIYEISSIIFEVCAVHSTEDREVTYILI